MQLCRVDGEEWKQLHDAFSQAKDSSHEAGYYVIVCMDITIYVVSSSKFGTLDFFFFSSFDSNVVM